MKKLLAIFRGSLHTIAIAAVVGVVVLYVAIHFNLAGLAVEHALTRELAEKLDTRVTVEGDVEVDWLNQVVLNNLTLYDQQDDTLLYARRALVAFDLLPLLQHHLVLNTCQLIDFDIHLTKDSLQGVHNFQFIVDAFKKKDPDSQSFIEKLDLNAILLRMGRMRYDVKDQPHDASLPLDRHHVAIEQLNANLHLHDQRLQFKKLHFMTGDAYVKANRCETVLNPLKAMQTTDSAFVINLQGLTVESPALRGKADIEVCGQKVSLQLHEFAAQGTLPGMPYMKDLEAQAEVHASRVLSPLDSIRFTAVIEQATAHIDKLGSTSLHAQIEGMPCLAEINGLIKTDKGEAMVQGTLDSNFAEHRYQAQGHCQTTSFELARLLPASAEIGTVAFDLDFDLGYRQQHPLDMRVAGAIDRLDYRHHTYRDIALEGESHGRQMQGRIQLADSLGDVDMTFALDLTQRQKRYQLAGTVSHLQPMALDLARHELLDSLAISGKLEADILASQWSDAEGILNLTHLELQRGNDRLRLEPIQFEGTAARGMFNSQMLHLDYWRDRQDKSYRIAGRLPVANELYALFRLPVQATNMSRFEAAFDKDNRLLNADVSLPTLIVNGNKQIKAYAAVNTNEEGLLLPEIDFKVQNSEHELLGTIRGELSLSPLEATLYPTTLLYNNEEIELTGAHMIRTQEGNYAFHDFSLKGAGQRLSASGVVGSQGGNDLIVQLERFELGQIFGIFDKGYLKFDGQATGDIVLSSDPEMHLKTDGLLIENFTYIDTLLGYARVDLDFELPQKRMDVSCDITTGQQHTSHAGGSIRLGVRDSLDLYFDTDHLPVGFISYWTGGILQEFSGTLTGQTRLYGDTKRLQLAGDPVVDGRFTHKIIGAHFHFNDTVHLEENLIALHDVTFDDCHGHPLQLNAHVTHDHLSHFGYEVDVDMPIASQGFLALDREQAPGRIYWGQLYLSGQANLKGGDGHHRFNLNVATTDKSWFYLSPWEEDFSGDNADGYSFLSFRDKTALLEMVQAEDEASNKGEATPEKQEDKTDIQMDVQVNATDQCQVYVQLDPLADDKLVCRGNGDLALHYDPRRDITLAGTYNISSGSYTMSMKGDLMNKVFQLQNTSTVRFNGVPSEAELALDARYSIPSVNLTDLDESITTLGSLSRSTVPVDCMLAVTGQLTSPQVSFDLEVKNVSDEIQTYVHNTIGTQEMLNQEVLYLLLFSKFYTPQYAQSTQGRSGSEITSFASASISSQLNQLLGHISSNFTMGTNFRTDRGDFSDMEMDVSLSTRLLGDRLLLNGNVGYRDPANRLGGVNNTNSFIGDFDLEFLINTSGTVRFKAYSHYNERDYSINNALTTQGVGFILRKDFQSFHELWRRKK